MSSAVVVVNWGRTLRVVPAIQLRREKVMAHLKSKWRSLFSSGRADRVTASAEVSRLSKVGQFLFFLLCADCALPAYRSACFALFLPVSLDN